jgi:hypothetical protein
MGLKETPSSTVLVVDEEELQLWHCQECSIFCSLSTSFWWVWPRALICCLQTQEKFISSQADKNETSRLWLWDFRVVWGIQVSTFLQIWKATLSHNIKLGKAKKYWNSIAETQLLQFEPTNAFSSTKIAIILQHTSSYMFQDSTGPLTRNIQLYKQLHNICYTIVGVL